MINHLRCNIDIKNRLLLCPLKFPYFSLYLILIRLYFQQSLQRLFWRFFYRFICNVVCEQIYWEGFKLHQLFPYDVLDLNKALSSLGMHVFLRAAPRSQENMLVIPSASPMSLLIGPVTAVKLLCITSVQGRKLCQPRLWSLLYVSKAREPCFCQ